LKEISAMAAPAKTPTRKRDFLRDPLTPLQLWLSRTAATAIELALKRA
jgi:hypothetical protein